MPRRCLTKLHESIAHRFFFFHESPSKPSLAESRKTIPNITIFLNYIVKDTISDQKTCITRGKIKKLLGIVEKKRFFRD